MQGTQIVSLDSSPGFRTNLPVLFMVSPKAEERFWEFFASNIRNRNTRRAYYTAVCRFSHWCGSADIGLTQVRPIHVATYIEGMMGTHSKASVKLHLAAIRALFDHLIVGQIVEMNPAHAVRGPKLIVRKGKTPPLTADDARMLFASINIRQLVGLRDRALIATMFYTFARVGATVALKVEDYYALGRDKWIRLQEKGGRENCVLVSYTLADYLNTYIDTAGIAGDPKGSIFRSSPGWADRLTDKPMLQGDVHRMINARAQEAGIRTKLCNHSCRAGGITLYRQMGGALERAKERAGHADVRTTLLYDHSQIVETRAEAERMAL
jgi:site-specific recombinase XerD